MDFSGIILLTVLFAPNLGFFVAICVWRYRNRKATPTERTPKAEAGGA